MVFSQQTDLLPMIANVVMVNLSWVVANKKPRLMLGLSLSYRIYNNDLLILTARFF
jgi:hypothetical protein